jgi:hypothetical protein
MIILLFRGLKALFFKLTEGSEFACNLSRGKWKFAKKISMGICGFVYGLLLFKFIQFSFKINLSFVESLLLHVLPALVVGILCSSSLRFRCILVLSLLEGCAKAGRNVLKVLVLFLILTGSITNIVENSKEVGRVFSCTTALTYNLSKTKFELIMKPVLSAFAQVDLDEIQSNFEQITSVVSPFIQEVEGESAVNGFVKAFQGV